MLSKQSMISLAVDKNGKISGFIDVVKYCSGKTKEVRLHISDIDVSWYLREGLVYKSDKEETIESRFIENESRKAFFSLLSVLSCKWVNRKETIDYLSSNKFYQQIVARKCGLSISRTLISNDYKSVVKFSDPKEGLLIKSIGQVRLDDNGKYFLYSQKFSHKELTESKDAIASCPVFSQEYVEKLYEHRVMVIGKKVLCCRIDSQASEMTRIDWRHYDFKNVEHIKIELPKKVQKSLLMLMRELGLQYGAIDLIETKDNDFVFLEINPSGQWEWISKFAGLSISEAVADMLASI